MTNAIILAAGKGTRLLPLTLTKHKALIEIDGKPIIENLIEQLVEQNIEKIIIVTGHLKEQFEYLLEKYSNVELIFNDKYEEYNNSYSIYTAQKYLKDCFIIEADVYIRKFDFSPPKQSTYFIKKIHTVKQEWIVKSDTEKRINDITVDYVDTNDEISAGITYLTELDGLYLKKSLEKKVQSNKFDFTLHWDLLLIENLKSMKLYSGLLRENTTFEIDDLADLQEVNSYFERHLQNIS